MPVLTCRVNLLRVRALYDWQHTNAELLWTCVVMFVGACVFGYIIGNGRSTSHC